MLGYYNYTVILTYLGMLSGFSGILFVLNGDLRGALACLVLAGLCDMFDGKLASTRHRTPQEKRFGIQIDSLSDLVCFGVLPGIIACLACGKSVPSTLCAAVYSLCALIRLAWFNVDEEERQRREAERRSVYFGLPVTSAALIFPLFTWLCAKCRWPSGTILPVLLLVTAAAFLTPFRLKKPALRRKWDEHTLQCPEEAEYIKERGA